MDKRFFGVMVALAMLVCVLIIGCAKQSVRPEGKSMAAASESTATAVPAKRSVGTVLKDMGSATATPIVSDNLKPFFVAGLGLIVLGAITFVFGGKGSAGGMVLMGVFTVWTGTSIIQYPWITLLAPIAMGVMLVLVMRDMWKTRKAAAVVVGAVEGAENKQEITGAIKEKGRDVVNLVRWLVDPIKMLLAKKGEEPATGNAG